MLLFYQLFNGDFMSLISQLAAYSVPAFFLLLPFVKLLKNNDSVIDE
jgi:hypothetical protein